MSIRHWPEGERPRERLLNQGAAALSDAELLAIFLRTGSRGRSAVDLGRDLLDTFGGLRPLLEADRRTFCAHHGLGEASFVQLQAVLEMARRHLAARIERYDTITGPETTRAFLTTQLRHRPDEVFACLFLDNRHRILAFEPLFHGTINGASVHPRTIVRRSLQHNAAAVIAAHNHPSGIAEPSSADRQITTQLRDALRVIDVRLLDHFVIGEEIVSFAERGLL
ncbi:MAG: RadC family protein [Pseudomonadota bacterium]